MTYYDNSFNPIEIEPPIRIEGLATPRANPSFKEGMGPLKNCPHTIQDAPIP